MLLNALFKALRDLALPGVWRLFAYCLLAYAVGWTLLAWGIGYALVALSGPQGAADILFLHLLGSIGGWLLAWFLFPLLYPILVSFFDDRLAEIVESADYPDLPKAVPPFWPTFAHDALFCLKAVGLNIILIPLYLMPLAGLAVYYGLNGYLLGVQFFRMAAGRRASAGDVLVLEHKARLSIVAGGILISFCSTIPFLNLAAPLLGVATMLHVFHAIRKA